MDAKFMANCHKIVIASTRRDLRFYDIAGNQMIEDYHLYGLNNVPHCLAYHYNEKVEYFNTVLDVCIVVFV